MRAFKIFLFILAAIALLALVCLFFPADGVKLFGTTLRFPSLEKIMKHEEKFDIDGFLSDEQRRQDSIAQVLSDSTDYYMVLLNDSATRFYLPNDYYTFFDAMFATMDSAQGQQRTVRLYFDRQAVAVCRCEDGQQQYQTQQQNTDLFHAQNPDFHEC